MAFERSVGAIIFRYGPPPRRSKEYPVSSRAAAELHVLLLRYRSTSGGHWDFSRGHLESGEREHITARREIQEETGISDLQFLQGFRERYRMHFQREGKPVVKEAVLYLAETKQERVRISDEHIGYAWLPLRDALKHLTFENSRNVLRRAMALLRTQASGSRENPPRRHAPVRAAK